MADVDLRVGGRTLVAMRAPAELGGGDMYSTWTYTEVAPYSASRTCSTSQIHKATASFPLIFARHRESLMMASMSSHSQKPVLVAPR